MNEDRSNICPIVSSQVKTVTQNLDAIIHDGIEEVEKRISANAKHENAAIRQVAEHVLKSGGKRIRARFVLISNLVFTEELCDDAIDIATAAELFHIATLLHDDVMDDAKLRRGRETVNSRWDPRTAILLGDFLLSRTFRLLRKVGSLKVMGSFIETAQELGEGALTEQFHKDDLNLSEPDYFYIISRKTASFFRTCASTGAILTERTEHENECLRDFGLNYGIAFQITDDLLDVISDEHTMGKPRGQDILEGHLTLPLIRYFAQDKKRIPPVRLSTLSSSDDDFLKLLEGLNSDGSLAYSYTRAAEYIEKALTSLHGLPQNDATALFKRMAADLIQRKA